MKKQVFQLSFILTFFLLLGCGGGDDPEPQKSAEEIAIEELTGDGSQTWVVAGGGMVTHNGQTVTSDYADFEMTFTASGSNQSYLTLNNHLLFDDSGSWDFSGSNYDQIVLSGAQPAAGQIISFSTIGSNLRLEFNVPQPSIAGGRIMALAGDYVFDLKKK
ncbi:hypothetical protein GCM10007049_20400 [Echinicola pacifica]|uniref:Uncharacterized protein n=1 Tax=Echinicola pacifica TaxID=346377 RepID=A0A918UR06_9BACT|nr:hypothetical protein [Echinicola pacifica]GGZ27485.1 hypothetical protein GCM10007049_20400 [Echinicola pacifica]